ncbi:C4-dicarboxylate ABC transporter permease [Candidatus Atribacteria bacterium 4572_76]|nr:MAG: C4-dicarboxylate ABC transporter permease [Candidatus Atribacteria bacterium 4572_76]
MLLLIIFGSFVLLLVIGTPIGVALGLSTAIVIYTVIKIPLIVVTQRMFTAIDSFSFMAIPFFMLAGSFMASGGVTKRLVNFANSLVGFVRGGLALVVAVTGMFFAAISGSSAATTAALGSTLFDEMEKSGYKRDFAAAIIASGGTTGIVIPPSITLVVFGITAGVSIGDLFLGGFAPGIIMGVSMCIVSYFLCKKKGIKAKGSFSVMNVLRSFKDSFLALMMPVIILGGIYGGIFTPTEAAAVAAVYGLIIGMFVYKELSFKNLPSVILNAAINTTVIMFIVGGANLFGWILTNAQVPHKVATFMVSISTNHIVFLMLVNLLLLFVGTLINASAAVVILVPILFPVAMSFGINPVFFGVLMIVNLAIGCITPPVGLDLFVVSGIAKLPIEKITKAILPYLIVLIVDLLILTYFPQIILFIPHLLGR